MADVTIVDVDATWVNPTTVSYDAGELRRADAAMYVAAGVVRDSATALAVSVDGSDVVTVKAGGWVIPGNAVAGSGVWRGGIAVDVTANLAARDATYGRIDLVVARQLDTDVVSTHGAYTGRVQILTGTPSASPAVPVLPSMAVELGRITVPASGGAPASVDSSHRTYAAAAGGEIVVPSQSALPAAAADAQRAYTLDTGVEYRFGGGTWVNQESSLPELELSLDSDQSIANTSIVSILWTSAPRNVGSMWSSGANVTIRQAGLYALSATAQWAGASNGGTAVAIYLNGNAIRWQGSGAFVNNELGQNSVSCAKRLAVGDVITFRVEQNSGASQAVQAAGGAGTTASVLWLRG